LLASRQNKQQNDAAYYASNHDGDYNVSEQFVLNNPDLMRKTQAWLPGCAKGSKLIRSKLMYVTVSYSLS
jgi:hypothetical protein